MELQAPRLTGASWTLTFYRHVSFETLLGLAVRHGPTSYWDIVKRDNPRKHPRQLSAVALPHIDEPESTG
jgi:hypothetical protein